MEFSYTINLETPSKKNSRITSRRTGRSFPSKRYVEWHKAAMAFAGLRHSEACAFGPSSIVDGRLRVVGKGDKEAFVPIGDRLRQEIDRHGCVVDKMFKRSRFSHNELANGILREAVEKAGLDTDGSNNHRFRHSFISNKIRSGVNIKAVSLLARHSDVNLTLNTYSHLLQDDLTDAANK